MEKLEKLNLFEQASLKLSKKERLLVGLVTFSSLFGWFEFFLFVYWSQIFESEPHFSSLSSSAEEFVYAILLLCSGLLARPIGGVIFGRMGDRLGRKKAFIRSVAMVIIPSLILTIIPSFPTWAYSSLIFLGFMRLLQGVPAGGELPGALCLLYEGASHRRKRYICSYLFVGTQLGQVLSILLIIFLQSYLAREQFLSWGWKISFGISSTMGIIGGLLGRKLFRILQETGEFENLKIEQRIEHHPLKNSFRNHKTEIVLALFLSIFEVTGFYLLYYYLFEKPDLLNLSPAYDNLVYLLYLFGLTLVMPVLGSLKYKVESLFKISALGVIFTSIPFFLAIDNGWPTIWKFVLFTVMILFFCIQFSFLPAFIASLFPTQVRFTCIGFSFNITDGVLGGMLPLFASWLTTITGLEGAFVSLFPLSAFIFLLCLKIIKKKNYSYGC